jgi:hypothetical protein
MNVRNKIQNIIIEIWKKAESCNKTAWLSEKQYNWAYSVLSPNQPEIASIFIAAQLNNGELLLNDQPSAIISVEDEIYITGYLFIKSTKNNNKLVSISNKTAYEIDELKKHIKQLKQIWKDTISKQEDKSLM